MDYKSFQSLGNELIQEFGNGAQAVITYQNGENVGKTAKAACVLLFSEDKDRFGTVHQRSKKAFLSGELKIAPQTGDILSFNKSTYTIQEVMDITPDGKTTCVYRVFL